MVFVKLPWYTQTFTHLPITFSQLPHKTLLVLVTYFKTCSSNLKQISLVSVVSHLILGQENCSVEQVKLIRDLLLDRLKYMYIYSRMLVTLTYSTEPTFFNHFMK